MHRIALALLLVAAACGRRPDRAKAQAACEHAVELGVIESAVGQPGGDGLDSKAFIAEMKKGPLWKEQVDKCTDEAVSESSPAQVDCVLAAKTGSDLHACD